MGYPWWAATDPVEVFFGQVQEPVSIVPTEKFHDCASQAMGREVLISELEDTESLGMEFCARVGPMVVSRLSTKVLALASEKQINL